MDFRYQYLQAMRDKAPQLMKQLQQSGQLDLHLAQKMREAQETLHNQLPDDPTMAETREAEERTLAGLLDFQDSETSLEQDERDALLSDQPLTSPASTI